MTLAPFSAAPHLTGSSVNRICRSSPLPPSSATVYALNKNGTVIPDGCASSCARPIGVDMLPMSSWTFTFKADIASPSGLYLWEVNLAEAKDITADNQIPFQFTVSVEFAQGLDHLRLH